MNRFDVTRFADWCGLNPDNVPSEAQMWLDETVGYHTVPESEQDGILAQLSRILDTHDPVTGPHRWHDWERGWEDVERRFGRSGHQLFELEPVYRYEPFDTILRRRGTFIRPSTPRFHRRFVESLLITLASHYLSACPCIHEFGCGTGWNLALLARQYPDQQWRGSDWATASGRILDAIRTVHDLHVVNGGIFDVRVPDVAYPLASADGVLTVAALEQVGADWKPFLDFVMTRHPSVCVHLEPIYERYNPEQVLDAIAIRYHNHRGYLKGYLPGLEALARQGRAEIMQVTRTVGHLCHEGHTIVVWRPHV